MLILLYYLYFLSILYDSKNSRMTPFPEEKFIFLKFFNKSSSQPSSLFAFPD